MIKRNDDEKQKEKKKNRVMRAFTQELSDKSFSPIYKGIIQLVEE